MRSYGPAQIAYKQKVLCANNAFGSEWAGVSLNVGPFGMDLVLLRYGIDTRHIYRRALLDKVCLFRDSHGTERVLLTEGKEQDNQYFVQLCGICIK